jgi:hypothetical protein
MRINFLWKMIDLEAHINISINNIINLSIYMD